MPNEAITKEEFLERARMYLGEAVFEAQRETVEPCDCGNEFCTGWKIDPGNFGEPEDDE